MTARCTALLAALSLALAGCNGSRDRPNILLISIDSLRADHLGCYGYERRTSPAIDALADQGVVFDSAHSSTSWTLPAHAAMFTGLPDSVHGCDRGTRRLVDGRLTLAEALRSAGYVTAGVWSGPYLSPTFGLDQGFDDWIACAGYQVAEARLGGRESDDPAWRQSHKNSHTDVTGPRIVSAVEGWLDRREDGPFLLFVHMWDVHYDYIPPAPHDRRFGAEYEGEVDGDWSAALERYKAGELLEQDLDRLVALYDGEIASTDEQVGRILELLAERGLDQNTVVVLTSDHGEEFGEHDDLGHRRTLFEESVRIPLVVRAPGFAIPGTRVDTPVRMVDIAPTLLSLAGAAPLPDILGRSLTRSLQGRARNRVDLVTSELVTPDEHQLIAVRGPDWKIVYDETEGEPVGLWNLATDPGEGLDVLGKDDRIDSAARRALGEVRDELARLRARHAVDAASLAAEMSPETAEQLRELGYTTDGPR